MSDVFNSRQIIHVDMDAFYASVEQRDDPSLQGRPVVVGGKPDRRGVVSAASYEARQAGIHSAMPLTEAYRRCPKAVFLPVNGKKYWQVSQEIRDVFLTYTPLVEPISIDEAFLDVTDSIRLFGSASEIAREIKERIKNEINLIASIGVASNKFLAKISSDLEKPNGFVVVNPDRVQEFLDPLSVERIWGVGDKMAERLHGLNIHTICELRQIEQDYLTHIFGTWGNQIYALARGIDDRPVVSEKEAKSIGRETTFDDDLADREVLGTILLELACDIAQSLRKEQMKGKTVTLKVRYSDFRTISRSHTLNKATNLEDIIYQEACQLLQEVSLKQAIRLIGITLHHLIRQDEVQLALFDEPEKKRERLVKVIDSIKEKYGDSSITRARLLH
ncbi:DNA polymerase IV [Desulfitobacterium metallireducens]|uniref:DNA polymerase IV n=1 Tax=Desulfitobacterium metallireducens DSM 15288 TaxID=871968 RepID=W0E7R0_9FIRM|nr:DNA polymerase IV [Desulfitobacterium metallireducens]AHF06802.1 DNA damage-inducible protein P [Desulfitobacterium metallireducens DSM 15288]